MSRQTVNLQHTSITRIQAAIRGYQVRNKYKINPLAAEREEPDAVYCTGNDPDFLVVPDALKSREPFALVATSCLRALDIAQLFCANNTAFIPKIFIVDFNPRVKDFWLVMKTIFNCSTNLSEFTNHIFSYEEQLSPLVNSEEEQNTLNDSDDSDNEFWITSLQMSALVERICSTLGFERVKKMVSNLVALTHDWTDQTLFAKIKSICERIGLNTTYVYASNIISCLDSTSFDKNPAIAQILRNITTLNPVATVHSNLNLELRHPTKMFCYPGTGNLAQLEHDIGTRNEVKKYSANVAHSFNLLFARRMYPAALRAAQDSYNAFKKLSVPLTNEEKSELSVLAHKLGTIYQEMGDREKALEYFGEAGALRVNDVRQAV